MRRLTVLLYITLIASWLAEPPRLTAQQSSLPLNSPSSENPIRDPQAIAMVQQAVLALGGNVLLSSIRDSVAQGNQQIPDGGSVISAEFVWKNAGNEFRYEYSTTWGKELFVSGHGSPGALKQNGVVHLNGHVSAAMFPLHLPGLVLVQELTNPQYSFIFKGQELFGDRQVIRVRTSLDADLVSAAVTPQEWLFDSLTNLPLRVEYECPQNMNALRVFPMAADLSEFRASSGVLIPFALRIYWGNTLYGSFTLTSVQFNTGTAADEFDLP